MGSFRFWFADQRWEWSAEVEAMHGYPPGTVSPTTELLIRHKHPDDRAHVEQVLAQVLGGARSFSSRHRIIDTRGQVHHVLVVADRILDGEGTVVGTEGHYIDLTDTLADNRRETLDDELPDLVRARAEIEQAKGVLMRMYRINADQAFAVLRWRSQETNTKIRDLAVQILTELPDLPPVPASIQNQFDHSLLTVHQRIPSDRASP